MRPHENWDNLFCLNRHLQFPFEGQVQDGGEQGVQFSGGLGLEILKSSAVPEKWQIAFHAKG
jgi:hypothetical protein